MKDKLMQMPLEILQKLLIEKIEDNYYVPVLTEVNKKEEKVQEEERLLTTV